MAEDVSSRASLPGFKAASTTASLWEPGDRLQGSVPLVVSRKL